MQTFDPNAFAALSALVVALAAGGAGFVMRRASRPPVADPDEPTIDELVRTAPYHRLGNNIRIVD